MSFGGPAAQIALMHRLVVQERRWVGERRFLHALQYCTLLPGPEAQQLATYLGWLLHKTPGGLVAGGLFVLPGAVVMLGLSALYAAFGALPLGEGLLLGLKAAVLGIVLEALHRLAKKALRGPAAWALAVGSFVGLFALRLPFPAVVLGAGLLGVLLHRLRPAWLATGQGQEADAEDADTLIERLARAGHLAHAEPRLGKTVGVLAACLAAWWGPLVAVGLSLGWGSVWAKMGVFLSKTAAVTFGGAYAALAYVGQEAVQRQGWLQAPQMLDGLGLAETTPGPLVLVLEFVGFVGAFQHPAPLSPWASGLLGAGVALWATFAPSFLWIFVGAPYAERVRSVPALRAALAAILAAAVGVIANLSAWFGLHALFGRVDEVRAGPLSVPLPALDSLSWPTALLAVAAGVALLRVKLPLLWVLPAAALLGALASWLWP
jgi:chromate transporter